MLNYFGQGALLLVDPAALENPFYRMAPGWGLYPLVILASLATIIGLFPMALKLGVGSEAYAPLGLGRLMAFLFIFQVLLSAPLSIASGAVGFANYLGFYWQTMTPVA